MFPLNQGKLTLSQVEGRLKFEELESLEMSISGGFVQQRCH